VFSLSSSSSFSLRMRSCRFRIGSVGSAALQISGMALLHCAMAAFVHRTHAASCAHMTWHASGFLWAFALQLGDRASAHGSRRTAPPTMTSPPVTSQSCLPLCDASVPPPSLSTVFCAPDSSERPTDTTTRHYHQTRQCRPSSAVRQCPSLQCRLSNAAQPDQRGCQARCSSGQVAVVTFFRHGFFCAACKWRHQRRLVDCRAGYVEGQLQ